MTTCARGCCWTPHGPCAHKRTCACHWSDHAPKAELNTGDVKTYRNPTQDQAIANIMRERKPR